MIGFRFAHNSNKLETRSRNADVLRNQIWNGQVKMINQIWTRGCPYEWNVYIYIYIYIYICACVTFHAPVAYVDGWTVAESVDGKLALAESGPWFTHPDVSDGPCLYRLSAIWPLSTLLRNQKADWPTCGKCRDGESRGGSGTPVACRKLGGQCKCCQTPDTER